VTLSLAPLALAALLPVASTLPETPAEREARMAWFREARFGMFIHWGLYAIPAGAWKDRTDHAEWILTTAQIPVDQYESFRDQFNPVQFNAQEWVSMARDAGMKYITITTKHHDGFCLFDSAHTDYDVMSTPFQRDIMAELASACAAQEMKMCWYHSIMDWHHPDYLPRRSWESRPAEGAKFERYEEYLHAQVTELLTKYGPIGVMWFDGEWEHTWLHEHGLALEALCRKVHPSVIINNRVDKGRGGMAGMTQQGFAGDFGTPEQEIPETGLPGVDWESCITMNGNWGFNAADTRWKSTTDLIRMLVDIVSKGGNLLLNVGPRADGTFPPEAVERLKGIGDWMEHYGTAIHGTTASPFKHLPWGRCTVKREGSKSHLNLFIYEWPESGTLLVPGLGNESVRATMLGASPLSLATVQRGGDVLVTLPAGARDEHLPVVRLTVEGAPIIYEAPEIRAGSDQFVQPLWIEMIPSSPELKLYYTLDGSEPTQRSAPYKRSIPMTETTTVRVRAFHGDRAVGPVASRTFTEVTPRAGITPGAEPVPGLRFSHFEGKWSRVPDFSALTPRASEIRPTIQIAPGEHQGATFEGYIRIDHDDYFVFGLHSDDGSRLLIDGEVVVDNDGLHSPLEKKGGIALAKGWHAIRVEWFNASGGADLSVTIGVPGGEPRAMPADFLFHAP